MDSQMMSTLIEKLPRHQQVRFYVYDLYCGEGDDAVEAYARFDEVLLSGKPVIIVHHNCIAELVGQWIYVGQCIKQLGNTMCLSSFVFSHFKSPRTSLAIATGGLVTQLFHSYIWGRDRLSGYVIQDLKCKPINEKATTQKAIILVKKPQTGSCLVRAALAVSAVSVSAYLLWKSMS